MSEQISRIQNLSGWIHRVVVHFSSCPASPHRIRWCHKLRFHPSSTLYDLLSSWLTVRSKLNHPGAHVGSIRTCSTSDIIIRCVTDGNMCNPVPSTENCFFHGGGGQVLFVSYHKNSTLCGKANQRFGVEYQPKSSDRGNKVRVASHILLCCVSGHDYIMQ
jgi:hypothetical protein